MIRRNFILLAVILLGFASCVERGKPVKKVAKEQVKNKAQLVEHYICSNGHKGSDKQGVCPECNVAYTHNQAYHGLSIPKESLKDPFGNSNTSNTTPAPAQNAYGEYHYTCPNGHPGGSGKADNCSTCSEKLVHNQLYHK